MVNFTPVQVQIQFGQAPPKFRRLYCTNKKKMDYQISSIKCWLSVTGNWHRHKALWPDGRHLYRFHQNGQVKHTPSSNRPQRVSASSGDGSSGLLKHFGSEHLQRKLASWVPSAFQKQSSQNLKQEQCLISVSVSQTLRVSVCGCPLLAGQWKCPGKESRAFWLYPEDLGYFQIGTSLQVASILSSFFDFQRRIEDCLSWR